MKIRKNYYATFEDCDAEKASEIIEMFIGIIIRGTNLEEKVFFHRDKAIPDWTLIEGVDEDL